MVVPLVSVRTMAHMPTEYTYAGKVANASSWNLPVVLFMVMHRRASPLGFQVLGGDLPDGALSGVGSWPG